MLSTGLGLGHGYAGVGGFLLLSIGVEVCCCGKLLPCCVLIRSLCSLLALVTCLLGCMRVAGVAEVVGVGVMLGFRE
mgnify:CR=1 FL=1